MDDFLLIILLIGVIFLFGISFLVFYVFKKLGMPKTGKVIGIGVFTIFTCFSTYIIFEDHFFFKNSARKELKEMNLVLNDDFEILKNESGGFTDYYHIFELKISQNDLNRLIENKNLKNNTIIVAWKEIGTNTWKKVKVDTENRILTYEHIIN